MKKFYQPVTQGPEFFSLTGRMVSQLKTVFLILQDEALYLVRIAVRKKWPIQTLENELVSLFEKDPTGVPVEKKEGTNGSFDPGKDRPGSRAFEWARLKTEFKNQWSGKNYSELIERIITENQKKIASSILKADEKRLNENIQKIFPNGGEKKEIKAPDISFALKRSSSLIKAADKSKLISKTRREEIRKVIKQVLVENPTETRTGSVRKDISKKVEGALKDYFSGYTKNSPPYGVPSNLHSIAVTETRFLINNVRHEYMGMTKDSLPEFQIYKFWVHNSSLSKNWRDSHIRMSKGIEIPFEKKFILRSETGKVYSIDGPHDPILDASEIINCNCEVRYRIAKKIRRPKNDSPSEMKDTIFDTYKYFRKRFKVIA